MCCVGPDQEFPPASRYAFANDIGVRLRSTASAVPAAGGQN